MKDRPFPRPAIWELFVYLFLELKSIALFTLLLPVVLGIPGLIVGSTFGSSFWGWVGWIVAGLSWVFSLAGLGAQCLREKDVQITDSHEYRSRALQVSDVISVARSEEFYLRERHLDDWLMGAPSIRIRVDLNYRKRTLRSFLRSNSHSFSIILRERFWRSRKKTIETAWRGKSLFNGDGISLCSNMEVGIEEICAFQAQYFDNLITNDFCSQALVSADDAQRIRFDGASMFHVLGDSVAKIGDYPLCNQIGVSTVAITSDGFIQLWQQSEVAQQSSGRIAATGSGSLDPEDIDVELDLIRTIRNGMDRELMEESSEHGSMFDRSNILRTVVTGYSRWLSRGAKPEFSGMTHLSCTLAELKPNIDEVIRPELMSMYLQRPAKTPHDLLDSLDDLLKNPKCAVSCHAALLRMREILASYLTEHRAGPGECSIEWISDFFDYAGTE